MMITGEVEIGQAYRLLFGFLLLINTATAAMPVISEGILYNRSGTFHIENIFFKDRRFW